MRLLGKDRLLKFLENHRDVRGQLTAWAIEVEESNWRTPHELKQRHPTASLVGKNRVIFNIRGNAYRLEALVDYKSQIVIVKRVGTHSEYSQWKYTEDT